MQNIRPWLWFQANAEAAANFYVSTFKNSRIIDIARYGSEGPGLEGSVMLVRFNIDGLDVMAINMQDDEQRDNMAMYANVEGAQPEIDRLWETLSGGGRTIACGWLVDKFGVWWNIVPREFEAMLEDADSERRGRVMQAMMQMIKLDLPTLQRAYDTE